MHDERAEGVGEIHGKAREAAAALEARSADRLELTKRIEELTSGAPGWYAGMRTRVEAGATQRQARVPMGTLEKLDEGS